MDFSLIKFYMKFIVPWWSVHRLRAILPYQHHYCYNHSTMCPCHGNRTDFVSQGNTHGNKGYVKYVKLRLNEALYGEDAEPTQDGENTRVSSSWLSFSRCSWHWFCPLVLGSLSHRVATPLSAASPYQPSPRCSILSSPTQPQLFGLLNFNLLLPSPSPC